MPIQLTFLGQYGVVKAQQPVKFATDYALALLAYLAVEADRPHARATLAGLLWPEQPESKARHNLRQAFFHLRKILGDPDEVVALFESTPKTIRCHAAALDLDARRFDQLLASAAAHKHDALEHCTACIERLQQAVALYQGEFLHDLIVTGSEPFEAWVRQLRARYHRQTMQTLATLASVYEARAEYARMGDYARRQLTLEPWGEAAHRQLMRSLALGGRRAAALAHYAVCCRILEEELGAPPSAATVMLYEAIRDGEVGPPAQAPTACTKRPISNASILPATMHSRLASTYRPAPAISTGRRPKRSDNGP